ncbi:serine/threonine-protein phosphatase 6 regulatory ankyrin repeat subunit B-like [Haliotis asinina]|uniref:serine/threonine-protein phosphatase 6 regulatory ankyrin repeat subunit B-like n=1 Tax=Haliotis asinina TaxID=109174 RepID=UPI003531F218
MGDFNIHIDDEADVEANIFADIMNALGLTQHVDFSNQRHSHILDHIYTEVGSTINIVSCREDVFVSDHCMIKIFMTAPREDMCQRRITYRKMSDLPLDEISKELSTSLTESSTDEMVHEFENKVTAVLDKFASVISKMVTFRKKKPWFTREIAQQEHKVRRRVKTFHKFRGNHHFIALKKERNQYKWMIKQAKGATISDKIINSKGSRLYYPGVTPQYMERMTLKRKLYDACKEGDLARVKSILSHTRVNMNGRYGEMKVTPLLVTASHGHRHVFEFLISKGANASLVAVNGGNILHAASEGGHEELVKCILSQNIVDVNSRDKMGRTPVMWAAFCGQRDVYNLLVKAGANISLVDNTLRNILFLATGSGHMQIVQDILTRDKAELNSRADGDMTALMLSAFCGNKEMYDLLISKGADVLLVDDKGWNILQVACWGGHVHVVKYILSQNIVDINSRDNEGRTSLMVSAYWGHKEVFDLLVGEGANVSLVADDGRHILHSAAAGGHVDMVEYILSQSIVDINIRNKEGVTPVMTAAGRGRREVYDLLVAKGADVSLVAHGGFNILHSAVKGGHVEIVKRVLSQGIVDINSRDKEGVTPVMWAAGRGRREVYDLLVAKGADVSLVAHGGFNILHAAVKGGHVEIVKSVLSQNIVDINSRDKEGVTPVMWAAGRRRREVYDLLVAKGADVSLVAHSGLNILHAAVKGGHVEIVKSVLSQDIVDINSRDKGGRTPVMWAAGRRRREVYDLLVAKGADVSLVAHGGHNILHSAVKGGHVEIVKSVLSQNIVDINSRDKEGVTPVMLAAGRGQREVYDLLVAKGADVSLVAHSGLNILHAAVKGGHVEIVKSVLSQAIVDINSRDKGGRTPVMWAAGRGWREVYDLLVAKGADVSLVAHSGLNILHAAVKGGHVEIVKSVLSQDIVDINSRDKGGRTPVMWAAGRGQRDVYDLLVAKGADISLVVHSGLNILHSAVKGGHVEIVKSVLSQNIVDINSRDRRGRTPVMLAVSWGRREVYDFLVVVVDSGLFSSVSMEEIVEAEGR